MRKSPFLLALLVGGAACAYTYTVANTPNGDVQLPPKPETYRPTVYMEPPSDRTYRQIETVFFEGQGSETWSCSRHDIKDFFPDLEEQARHAGGDAVIVASYDTSMNCVKNVSGVVIQYTGGATASAPATSPRP